MSLAQPTSRDTLVARNRKDPEYAAGNAVVSRPPVQTVVNTPVDAKRITVDDNKRTDRVAVGDTVRVRYLTDDKRVVQFTISREKSDPSSGIIYFRKPIAEALLGAEEGDEVEILVGSYLRPAILEKIVSRLN